MYRAAGKRRLQSVHLKFRLKMTLVWVAIHCNQVSTCPSLHWDTSLSLSLHLCHLNAWRIIRKDRNIYFLQFMAQINLDKNTSSVWGVEHQHAVQRCLLFSMPLKPWQISFHVLGLAIHLHVLNEYSNEETKIKTFRMKYMLQIWLKASFKTLLLWGTWMPIKSACDIRNNQELMASPVFAFHNPLYIKLQWKKRLWFLFYKI